jgi:hypothetical protein
MGTCGKLEGVDDPFAAVDIGLCPLRAGVVEEVNIRTERSGMAVVVNSAEGAVI